MGTSPSNTPISVNIRNFNVLINGLPMSVKRIIDECKDIDGPITIDQLFWYLKDRARHGDKVDLQFFLQSHRACIRVPLEDVTNYGYFRIKSTRSSYRVDKASGTPYQRLRCRIVGDIHTAAHDVSKSIRGFLSSSAKSALPNELWMDPQST